MKRHWDRAGGGGGRPRLNRGGGDIWMEKRREERETGRGEDYFFHFISGKKGKSLLSASGDMMVPSGARY